MCRLTAIICLPEMVFLPFSTSGLSNATSSS